MATAEGQQSYLAKRQIGLPRRWAQRQPRSHAVEGTMVEHAYSEAAPAYAASVRLKKPAWGSDEIYSALQKVGVERSDGGVSSSAPSM